MKGGYEMAMRSSHAAARSAAFCAAVLAAGLAAAGGLAGRPALASEKGVGELIPRQLIFGNPERSSPNISPDGRKLAFLAPDEGVLNVWVGPADDPSAAKPVTKDRHRGVRMYYWAYTSNHILYLQDKDGDENWRVHCVDLVSGAIRDLTPFEGVQARIQELSHRRPEEILVAINNREPALHDIHRVNITTGEMTLVQKNEFGEGGFIAFLTDSDFRVRFGLTMEPDGGQRIMQPAGESWEVFQTIEHGDTLTTSPVGFDAGGQTLYMVDSRGRDTAALTAVDLKSDETKVLAQDPRADIDDTLVHPTEHTVQAAGFSYERKQWVVLDQSLKADFEYLQTVVDGDFDISSRSLDDRRWVVTYSLDSGPARFYLYERDSRNARLLFTARPALEKYTLARMHPTTIRSRDGLDLVSYLTLPPQHDADGNGRPDKPLPTVLLVHGGPWARDLWGFDPEHQWLANRGYAVLSVNFRGSTGFGKKFTNAGDLEWAAKMHDDLVDAVRWAVREKIADPDRVAIMGGSYGGYATLVGLTFTPDLFACGVDIVGPSNLVTLLESIPPYWQPLVELFAKRVGDHRTEEGRKFLMSRSPISFVDKIRRPLLIGQGANDPRVKQAESDQIVTAMRKKSIPVTYALYPDEGHGFARPENRLSFFAVAEAFLGEHLGGTIEPFGDDLEGSSLKVPTGADEVPGLKDALGE